MTGERDGLYYLGHKRKDNWHFLYRSAPHEDNKIPHSPLLLAMIEGKNIHETGQWRLCTSQRLLRSQTQRDLRAQLPGYPDHSGRRQHDTICDRRLERTYTKEFQRVEACERPGYAQGPDTKSPNGQTRRVRCYMHVRLAHFHRVTALNINGNTIIPQSVSRSTEVQRSACSRPRSIRDGSGTSRVRTAGKGCRKDESSAILLLVGKDEGG